MKRQLMVSFCILLILGIQATEQNSDTPLTDDILASFKKSFEHDYHPTSWFSSKKSSAINPNYEGAIVTGEHTYKSQVLGIRTDFKLIRNNQDNIILEADYEFSTSRNTNDFNYRILTRCNQQAKSMPLILQDRYTIGYHKPLGGSTHNHFKTEMPFDIFVQKMKD